MSEDIGNCLPPPLQFELGTHDGDGPAPALLLVTVDPEGMPRIAVFARAQLRASDPTHLTLAVSSASQTCKNLKRSGQAAIWCVLDAAAYTIRAEVQRSERDADEQRLAADPGLRHFHLVITQVLRDFQSEAPMIAGPTYRRMGA